ncbi:hypothetical protein [Tepidibacter hydrothermalis]|uniref:Uncharacterized protein n=1 Tax=Tepidibacter hydrothermalis TaxID=3036126 RepID=A0ABY8EKV0_9FIRM|nr:hypothetical protein [Tepidibacter hydrothermalis]WFD11925.1 hypothetical protein P4S50_07575 [Tepidibacter hydrothermalis]
MLNIKNAVISIVLAIIMTMNVHACWVHLSVAELFQNSNVILIGTVQGESRKKIFSEYNVYNVNVHYYLKGNIQKQNLTVATPDNTTSLHYDLNEKGSLVLLFLHVDNRNYTPLSPQGVVPVSIKEDILEKENIISGKELVKFLEIIDSKLEDKEKNDIKHIIENLDVLTIKENCEQNNISTNLYFVIGFLVLLSTILINKHIKR